MYDMSARHWKIILLFSVFGVGCYACKRKFTREVIERNNCHPKRILNFICIGSCHGDLSGKSQCSITTVRQKTVQLLCSNRHGLVRRNVTVPVPASCSCTQESVEYVYMPIVK
jgi:hypothetical protein